MLQCLKLNICSEPTDASIPPRAEPDLQRLNSFHALSQTLQIIRLFIQTES